MAALSHFLAAALAVAGLHLASPVLAQNNDYGGYDIGGDPGIEEEFYGSTRGWSVYVGRDARRHAYCAAETQDGDTVWRIGTDGGQWQIALVADAPADWEGNLDIDGKSVFISGTAVAGWTILWLGQQELSDVANGSNMIVDVGRASIQHPLRGTAAVITKIEECIGAYGGTVYQQNNGVVPKAKVASSRKPVAPRRAPLDYAEASYGDIPANALEAGYDTSGATLYVCFVHHRNGLHPGKISADFGSCHFGYGGTEYENTSYYVLVGEGSWQQAAYGEIPYAAMEGGREADGGLLYVCRAEWKGLQIGKIGPSTGSCAITHGGVEHTVYEYEVLTLQ